MPCLTFFIKNKKNFPIEAVEIHSIGRRRKVFESQEHTRHYYTLVEGANFRLRDNTILQYSAYTGTEGSEKPTEKNALLRPIFVSEYISNCQVVLIKQNKDLWMLHTSPAGISGGCLTPFGGFRAPMPFLQIAPELDTSAKTQVVVIPSYTCDLWDERVFLAQTRLKKEDTIIEVLAPELFYTDVAPYIENHNVGYDIENDRLWIVGGNKETTAHRYDRVFDAINASLKRSPVVYSAKSRKIKGMALVETNSLGSVDISPAADVPRPYP